MIYVLYLFAYIYICMLMENKTLCYCFPVGFDEITVHPIKRKFDYIYCTAMQLPNDMACNLLMTDEKGNYIMRLNGFRVS